MFAIREHKCAETVIMFENVSAGSGSASGSVSDCKCMTVVDTSPEVSSGLNEVLAKKVTSVVGSGGNAASHIVVESS